MAKIVSFQIDNKKLALPVNDVRCVLLALEIITVPGQTVNLLGVVEIEEEIIPVINLRHIVNLPERELELQDQIIIAETKSGPIGMMADVVHGVLKYDEAQVAPIDPHSGSYAQGLLKIDGELHLLVNASGLVPESELLLRGQAPAGGMR